MRKKKFWILVSCGFLAILVPTLLALKGAQANMPLRLLVNGKEIASDPPPFVQDGRTFVPVRFVAEALGYPVKWDPQTNSVIIGTPPEGADLLPYDHDVDDTDNIQGIAYKNVVALGGIGHPSTSCRYNLQGSFTKVKLLVAPGAYQASLSVYGDGQKISTFQVDPSEPPKEITVDTQGVQILTLSSEDTNPFSASAFVIYARGIR